MAGAVASELAGSALSEGAALERLFDFALTKYRKTIDSFTDAYEEEDAEEDASSSAEPTLSGIMRLPVALLTQLLGADGLRELQENAEKARGSGGSKTSPAQGGSAAMNARRDAVAKLTLCFKACAGAVEKLALFSAGEDWDEVATKHLRYLLLPYFLGRLSMECSDLQQRLNSLRETQVFFREFMADVERLGICRRDDVRAFDALVDELQQSAAGGQAGPPRASAGNPAARRDELVARAKFEKEVDAKVAALLRKRREAARRNAGQEDQEEGGLLGVDDEDERDFWASMLSRAAADTVTQMGLVIRELPLLTMRLQDDERRGGSEANDSRLFQGRPGAAGSGEAVRKPWVYTIKDRSDLRRLYREKVFTPGHNLPTMSLAECAAIEMEMEVNQIGATKPKIVEEYTTTQARAEREEKEELEERAWDDWKDENPRGSGNKMVNKG
ncbi:TAP42 family protein [Besnoitia besnoiti]|uniref:TAP42 family protein n=1 Tax=Besnoitia besnoiti TaxID=94643 RepID=A0A2A9MG15_BESBE|nr:TAP42 family protein [Besnoitia besnoiti]PFH37458.1 TAP42 family protein [Besnoitia besnoiti]